MKYNSLKITRLNVPNTNGRVQATGNHVNSVKLQRVNTIGVTGKGMQALFRFRVPYFDLKY